MMKQKKIYRRYIEAIDKKEVLTVKKEENAGKESERFHPGFTSLLKPMFYIILFSVLYGIGYTAVTVRNMTSPMPETGIMIFDTLWLAVYGLGMYFVFTLIWGKKRGTLRAENTWKVLLWNILISLTIRGAAVLALWLSRYSAGLIAGALLCLLVLICAVPVILVFWYLIYLDEDRTFVDTAVRTFQIIFRKPVAVQNGWLIILAVQIVWNSLFSGPLSVLISFNPGVYMINFMYLGEPFVYSVLLGYLSAVTGAADLTYVLMLDVLFSLILVWAVSNLGLYIRRQTYQIMKMEK